MMERPNLLERLRHNVLFGNMSDEAFEDVRGKLVVGYYKAHDGILDEDGIGKKLYLIVDGSVKILKKMKNGDEILLALLHHGDCFGELELIDIRPRSSRVVAEQDCITYELTKNHFEKLLKENHPFAIRLLQLLSVRLRALNHKFVRELSRICEQSYIELNKLQQLIEAAKIVNSTLDLDKLLTVILEAALQVVGADRGTVYLIDYDRRELWSKVLKGTQSIEIRLGIGKGIAGYVAATGDTLNIEDAYLDHRFNPEVDGKTGYRTKSILCMPMKNKEQKIIGVFQLLNKLDGTFTFDDENFIDALSVHSSIAIENARLHEQEGEKIAMEKDLVAAREVQMSLLPKSAPHVKGYDIAGRSIPAKAVGGDYFDFIPIDQHRIVFCLGDVSGKGLPAALLMANLQATLRGQMISEATPKVWIRRSNRLLHESTTPDKFVTLFFGCLDRELGTICYCNAGHDHPFFISSSDDVKRLKTGGIILSVMNDYPYEEETITMHPGGLLVAYSDGVTEAMNAKKQQFQEKRLMNVILKHRNLSATEIIDAILEAVKKHILSHPQFDDITVVVIKRLSE